jgi:hypothetical protein
MSLASPLALALTGAILAHDPDPTATATATAPAPAATAPALERRWSLTGAYLGEEVFHAGGQLGVEYVLARWGWLSVAAGANLGAYAHYRFAAGLYLDGALAARATTSVGFLVELAVDAGYLHLFPWGPVYQVPAGGGAPVGVANLGRPALRFGGTLGLGVDAERTTLRWPLTITVRLGAFGEADLVGGVVAHPEALLCLGLRLG